MQLCSTKYILESQATYNEEAGAHRYSWNVPIESLLKTLLLSITDSFVLGLLTNAVRVPVIALVVVPLFTTYSMLWNIIIDYGSLLSLSYIKVILFNVRQSRFRKKKTNISYMKIMWGKWIAYINTK